MGGAGFEDERNRLQGKSGTFAISIVLSGFLKITVWEAQGQWQTLEWKMKHIMGLDAKFLSEPQMCFL